MIARRDYDGPSGVLVSYIDYVYLENPEEESLTNMTVYEGRTIATMTVRRRSSSWETLKKVWRPL